MLETGKLINLMNRMSDENQAEEMSRGVNDELKGRFLQASVKNTW